MKNTILQIEVAKQNKPVILSTGGGNLDDVKRAVENISKFNGNLAILHCTASYPVEINDMNLNVINTYKKSFLILQSGFQIMKMELMLLPLLICWEQEFLKNISH